MAAIDPAAYRVGTEAIGQQRQAESDRALGTVSLDRISKEIQNP
jgi:hypothetical protein